MSETRNMDSAIRVKEMNNAREKIGEDRFLGRDNDIKESIQYGLCEELVLNDPDYKNKISKNKSIYERERRLKYEENKRFEERQKKETEERLRKLEEEKRKQQEEERKRKEKRKEEATKNFNNGVNEFFTKYPPKPKLERLSFGMEYDVAEKKIYVDFFCSSLGGFDYKITIELKDNLGSISISTEDGWFGIKCAKPFEIAEHTLDIFTNNDNKENMYELRNRMNTAEGGCIGGEIICGKEPRKRILESLIKSVNLSLIGTTSNTGLFYDWVPRKDLSLVQEGTYQTINKNGVIVYDVEDLKFTTRYEFQLYPDE